MSTGPAPAPFARRPTLIVALELALVPLVLALAGGPAGAQTPLLVAPGDHPGDRQGAALAALPDLDGDDVPELIVGAPGDGLPATGVGGVRVFGSAGGAQLLRLVGTDSSELFGAALAGLPDVNGDGAPDLAVGAPHLDPGEGRVCVHSGLTGALLYTLSEPGTDPADGFGAALAALPDLNGDGRAELCVGRPSLSGQSAGSATVFSGADGLPLFTIDSPFPIGGRFGAAVGLAGDTNGDGTPDLIIGAPLAPAALIASGLDGSPLLELTGAGPSFGAQVGGAGDFNDDGLADVVVATPGLNFVDVLSGSTGVLLRRYQRDSGAFGTAVAPAGDADGDGRHDFLIGAPEESIGGLPAAGSIYLVSGDTGVVLFKAAGQASDERQGAAAAVLGSAADADLAAGAPQAAGASGNAGGLARLYNGAYAGAILPYGFGCPGSFLITPRLDLVGDPLPNGELTLSVTRALGGSFGVLFFGSGQGKLPLSNGCILWTEPLLPLQLTLPLIGPGPGAGTATLVGRLPPATPSGLVLTLQFLVSDRGADGGIAATSAIQLTVL